MNPTFIRFWGLLRINHDQRCPFQVGGCLLIKLTASLWGNTALSINWGTVSRTAVQITPQSKDIVKNIQDKPSILAIYSFICHCTPDRNNPLQLCLRFLNHGVCDFRLNRLWILFLLISNSIFILRRLTWRPFEFASSIRHICKSHCLLTFWDLLQTKLSTLIMGFWCLKECSVAPLSDGAVSGTRGFSRKGTISWSSVLLTAGGLPYLDKWYRDK